MDKSVLASLIATQILLYVAYAVQFRTLDTSNVWGRISTVSDQRYYLGTAAIAYVCHLALALLLASEVDLTTREKTWFLVGFIGYYLLQMAFIPLLLMKNKTYMRVLLGVCIPLVLMCSAVGVHRGYATQTISRRILYLVLSIVPLLHVTINDFALFAFRT